MSKIKKTHLLKFNKGNAKIGYHTTAIMSLPAGYTCPGAGECHARSDQFTGKRTVGSANQRFICFAASMEAYAVQYRKDCWNNYRLLTEAGTVDGITSLINDSIEAYAGRIRRIRLHGGGDFFSESYLYAWLCVAHEHPEMLFYGYTKSIPFYATALQEGRVPDNMRMVLSYDGVYDIKIDKLLQKYPTQVRAARVVFHPSEAEEEGLEIDHDDEIAALGTKPEFALLLHGMQAAKSGASDALRRMRTEKVAYGYRT